MSIPKYVSAEEYSRQSGIGVEEVKRLCRTNQLKHFMTEGGYYKIAVDDDSVPKGQYDKVKEENTKLKIVPVINATDIVEVKKDENLNVNMGISTKSCRWNIKSCV